MVETLKLIAPRVFRIGIIYNPDNAVNAIYLRMFNAVAGQIGVEPANYPVHTVDDIEQAIIDFATHRTAGLSPRPTSLSWGEQPK